jgi:heme-degrading monooxygenase HmoA
MPPAPSSRRTGVSVTGRTVGCKEPIKDPPRHPRRDPPQDPQQEENTVVVEHVLITVTPGREAEFEAEFPKARAVLDEAEGFLWGELHRFVERPSTFLVLLGWETLEAHTVTFRNSDLFPRWRAVVGPFFAEPPVVEHLRPVTAGITAVSS